jgi:hypothetical protein
MWSKVADTTTCAAAVQGDVKIYVLEIMGISLALTGAHVAQSCWYHHFHSCGPVRRRDLLLNSLASHWPNRRTIQPKLLIAPLECMD